MRKIIHADCDSFYASVEMRDNPKLRDLPIAVGGRPDKRGVVATCNYNARAYGVHSAMPMSQALRICPELVVVPTNMAKYKAESIRIHSVFRQFTEVVEPLSLDEAYLDVSDCDYAAGSATLIAQEIRKRVREQVGITISAGIAPNKFLAKVASDWNKPDGQYTVSPDQVQAFVTALPVEKLFGVGSVTAKRMHDLQIRTCADLQAQALTMLTHNFGSFGARLYELCRGIDDRQVKTQRIRKSVSVERTYAEDLTTMSACRQALCTLVEELQQRIAQADCRPLIIQRTVKVRFAGFATTTAANSGADTAVADYQQLFDIAWQRQRKPVRLIGIGVKLAAPMAHSQLGLFG